MTLQGIRFSAVLALLLLTLSAGAQDVTVYITKTGTKYHLEGCASLSRSAIPISLENAIARQYTPCSICRPPVASSMGISELRQSVTPRADAPASLYCVDLEHIRRPAQADLEKMLPALVSRHIDGDTIEVTFTSPPQGVALIEKVRLIGIDTPEIADRDQRMKALGLEASKYTKQSLLGKTVLLAFESSLRDTYGRMLAYVYLVDGTCFNSEMVRLGYARTYIEYPCQFIDELLDLEKGARSNRFGIWQD